MKYLNSESGIVMPLFAVFKVKDKRFKGINGNESKIRNYS